MRVISTTTILATALLSLASVLTAAPAFAATLVSPTESALPPAPPGATAKLATRSGVTRGPGVEVLAPLPDANSTSPLPLQLHFMPHGGAKIDPFGVTLTDLKSPNVDLTERVRPYLTADGIDMRQAELPPGDHALRLDLRDSEGHTTSLIFTLHVAK